MNYCPNCGRPLADGEVCNCNQNAQQIPPPQPTSSPFPDPAQTGSSPYMDQPGGFDPYGTPVQNTQQGTPPPQGYYQNPQQNYYQNPQGQPYQNQQPGPGYQYQYQPGVQPPQKKGPNGCLIAALICIPIFLVIAAVLVAIIVPAMIGYTKKAKSASANALAKQLYNAAMTAAVDLDSQGVNMAGYFICGEFSDGVTEVNLTEFRETMETYLDEDFDCTYFVVVEDGSCTYACIQTEDGDYGTYPLRPARSCSTPAIPWKRMNATCPMSITMPRPTTAMISATMTISMTTSTTTTGRTSIGTTMIPRISTGKTGTTMMTPKNGATMIPVRLRPTETASIQPTRPFRLTPAVLPPHNPSCKTTSPERDAQGRYFCGMVFYGFSSGRLSVGASASSGSDSSDSSSERSGSDFFCGFAFVSAAAACFLERASASSTLLFFLS